MKLFCISTYAKGTVSNKNLYSNPSVFCSDHYCVGVILSCKNKQNIPHDQTFDE